MSRFTLSLLATATLATTTLGLLATPAFANTPTVRATAGGTLQLEARLSHGYVPIGKPATVHASISIKGADQATNTESAPLNVSLVIDRSTSMDGDKIVQALKASHTFVEMLGPKDRLSIVSYGSDVAVHAEPMFVTDANKKILRSAIDKIQTSGMTNLSGGYETARNLVLLNKRDDSVNRVILLSDGQANVGQTTLPQLAQLAKGGLDRGVALTTIGIGLDYNEDLMRLMAVEGAGNYYFVENEAAIAGIFRKEVSWLASTVARGTVLEIEMAPGVELLDLQGFAHTTKGGKATVRLAEFFARQQKDILLKLAVSPQASGVLPIVTARLRFDDVTKNDQRVSSSATLRAVATADAGKLKEVDTAVLKRVQQVETARAFDEAMQRYEKGEAEAAAQIVAQQRSSNQAFMKSYDLADDDVAGFQRVDKELDSLGATVTAKPASSTEGKRALKKQKARSYDIATEAASF